MVRFLPCLFIVIREFPIFTGISDAKARKKYLDREKFPYKRGSVFVGDKGGLIIMSGSRNKKGTKVMILGGLVAGAIGAFAGPALAADHPGAEIRRDQRELQQDLSELQRDRRELHQDLRSDAGRGEIARDRAEIRQDRDAVRNDHGELRHDLNEHHRWWQYRGEDGHYHAWWDYHHWWER